MSSKNWIEFPRVEGETSRQAHADLPAGTYEREIGRDGFFGPATHIYHKHPPTGWSSFEGPLRPRAFDGRGGGFCPSAMRSTGASRNEPSAPASVQKASRLSRARGSVSAVSRRSHGAPVRPNKRSEENR